MSGQPKFAYPRFHSYAELWRNLGYDVLNPAERFEGRTDLPYEVYLKSSIIDLLAADAIALISGWEDSKGAVLERHIARVLGLHIWNADNPPASPGGSLRGQAGGLRTPEREHAADRPALERVDGGPRVDVPVPAAGCVRPDDPPETGEVDGDAEQPGRTCRCGGLCGCPSADLSRRRLNLQNPCQQCNRPEWHHRPELAKTTLVTHEFKAA